MTRALMNLTTYYVPGSYRKWQTRQSILVHIAEVGTYTGGLGTKHGSEDD